MNKARISSDGRTVTVRVPMKFAKRGGRKLIIAPEGASAFPTTRPRIDSTLIKALARGFRWRKLLETGVFTTVEDIAKQEKIDSTYVGRILRLTLLAPVIVEAILDGRHGGNMMLAGFMRSVPVVWAEQRRASKPFKLREVVGLYVPRLTQGLRSAAAMSCHTATGQS